MAPIPTERQWTTDTGFREMPRGAAQDPDRQDVVEARRANALHAAEILEQNGYTSDGRNGTQRLRPNHTYVMQIDQAPPEGRLGGYASTYTGQTAVFRTNQDGHLEQVRESGIYASSSHPQPANRTPVERFGHNRVGSRDVDGNRTVDYPLLTRGMHEYHSRVSTDGREQYGLISGTHGCLVVPHDTNQDYRTQPDTDQRHHSYGLNIHAGGDTNLASTGCQNIRGPEFGSFRNAVTASTPSSETFTYVLASRPNVGSDFGDKHRAQEHAARRR